MTRDHSVKLLNLIVAKVSEFSFAQSLRNGIFDVDDAVLLEPESQLLAVFGPDH